MLFSKEVHGRRVADESWNELLTCEQSKACLSNQPSDGSLPRRELSCRVGVALAPELGLRSGWLSFLAMSSIGSFAPRDSLNNTSNYVAMRVTLWQQPCLI